MARTEPLGIDISKWVHPVNWDKFCLNPIEWVAARATIAVAYKDPWFEHTMNTLSSRDVPVTAYHVVRPDYGARQQSDWFVSAIRSIQAPLDMPAVLDCELDCGKSRAQIAQTIYDIAHFVEDALGHKPMIYSRTQWINFYVGTKQWFNEYDWWMAYYSRFGESQRLEIDLPPTIDRAKLKIHQTWDRGPGKKQYGTTSKQIDYNRWVGSGTPAEYIAKFRGEGYEKPITAEEKLDRLWQNHPGLW